METRTKLVILIGIVAYIAVFNLWVYDQYIAPDMYLDMDFKITNGSKVEFNLDTDALHFGAAPAGGTAGRNFTVTNYKRTTQKITLVAEGNISKMLYLTENKFILEPGYDKTVRAIIHPDENATIGTYTGRLFFYFRDV